MWTSNEVDPSSSFLNNEAPHLVSSRKFNCLKDGRIWVTGCTHRFLARKVALTRRHGGACSYEDQRTQRFTVTARNSRRPQSKTNSCPRSTTALDARLQPLLRPSPSEVKRRASTVLKAKWTSSRMTIGVQGFCCIVEQVSRIELLTSSY